MNSNTDPLIIGTVGNFSGPTGSAELPFVQATQAWVKWKNATGGIAGHKIVYHVVDDGNDTARQAAGVQDLYENKKIIALVNQVATVTQRGSLDYINKNKIPVVGGAPVTTEGWGQSEYFFPVSAGAPETILFTGQFDAARASEMAKGKSKLGVLVCVEALVCSQARDAAKKNASKYGFNVVGEATGSLAQPDYTQQCLAMRQAGAELVNAWFDPASMVRLMRSCLNVDFKPIWIQMTGTLEAKSNENPAAQQVIQAGLNFPFTAGNFPSLLEMQDVVAKYAPDLVLQPSSSTGWASARLFEKAVLNGIGTGKPSKEGILEGIWQIKDDTLGGAAPPLTFPRGKIPPNPTCYFVMYIQSGKWVAPYGDRPRCLPPGGW